MTCHIIGAGEFFPFDISKSYGDMVIACDAGYNHAKKMNVTPDLTIGDFDSLRGIPDGEVIKLPVEKDYTDVGAAVEYALKKGFDDFKFYCCLGNRLSHTYANIQIGVKLSRMKKTAFFYGKENLTVITDTKYSVPKKSGGMSVFSVGNAHGVTLTGFKYPLENYDMTDSFPIGVSNEIISDWASVEVKSGTLILIF